MQDSMSRLCLICFIVFVYIFGTKGKISDKRLCADPECSIVVSHARPMIKYSSADHRILSFNKGELVKVFSKSAGTRKDLWGVEIRGKRGYAPEGFLREHKILVPTNKLTYEVPTEQEETKPSVNVTASSNNSESAEDQYPVLSISEDTSQNLAPSVKQSKDFQTPAFGVVGVSADLAQEGTSSPEGISQPIEVVDGTLLYLDTKGDGSLSKPIHATATNTNIQPSAAVPDTPTQVAKAEREEPKADDTTQLVVPDNKLEEPNASMVLPTPATSSADDHVEQDVDKEESVSPSELGEVEGSAEWILGRVTNWIKGDGATEIRETRLEEGGDEEMEDEGSGEDDEEEEYEDEEDGDEEEEIAQDDDVESVGQDKPEDLPKNDQETEASSENTDSQEVKTSKDAVSSQEAEAPVNATATDENKTEETNNNETVSESLEQQPAQTEQQVKLTVKDFNSTPLVLQMQPVAVPVVTSSIVDSKTDEPKEVAADKLKGAQTLPLVANVTEGISMNVTVHNKTVSNAIHEGLPADANVARVNQTAELNRTEPEVTINKVQSMVTSTRGAEVLENSLPPQPVEQRLGDAHSDSKTAEETSQDSSNEPLDQEITSKVDEIKGTNSEEQVSSNVDLRLDGSLESNTTQVPEEQEDQNRTNDIPTEQVLPTINKEPVEHVITTTKASSDWIPEPLPYVQDDAVTEGYIVSDEQVSVTPSPIRETDAIPAAEDAQERVVEDVQQRVEDTSQERAQEDSHESVEEDSQKTQETGDSSEDPELKEQPETETSGGFFLGITNTLFSGYMSLSQMVLGPSVETEVLEDVAVKTDVDGEDTGAQSKVVGEDARKRDVRDMKWSSLWGSPERAVSHEIHEVHQEGDHLISVSGEQTAPACVSGCEPSPVEQHTLASTQQHQMNNDYAIMDDQKGSLDTLLFLVVTAVTVLLFSLGYYYIEKKQRDGSLVAKINSLEKALLVSSKENFILKDNLEETKEKLSSIQNSSTDSDEVVTALEAELEESKAVRSDLEEQVVSLERELEAATEAGLELNRMLSEFLSAQHGSDTLMKSVEHLQKQLDNQQGTISTMNSSLSAKSMENESLQADLNIAEERIKALEDEIQKVSERLADMQKEKQELEHEFQQKSQTIETQLVEALESKSVESQRLCRELDALQDVLDETRRTLASRDGELAVLRDCLRQADDGGGTGATDRKLEALMDVGHARAELALVAHERDGLTEKLQGEEEARKLLEGHVRIVSEEVASLRAKYRDAEREKVEAQTRLEVLSNYFKEKETQLQKELGLQEAMCIQKDGDAMSTFERIKSLQEEVESYKSQNETLKKEILDQERGLKAQIATLEKKVHENWVVARQAERRLEESKQESGQLRNRLTLVERNLINATHNATDAPKLNDRHPVNSNGELPTSPLPMGLGDLQDLPGSPLHYGHPSSPPLLAPSGQTLPPVPFPPGTFPPGAFLPHPPPGLPFLPPILPPGPFPPGDRRPPPLGRMSSPPPPEPRGGFSPYDRSPPLSPPGRPYRSPPPRYDDSPERYRHRSPPPHNSHHPPPFSPYPPPGMWDDRHPPPRSGFRPLRRESPREPKGSTLSSGHSSESLDNKSSRHSGRV